MDIGISIKSQLKTQNFPFEWLKQITIYIFLNKKIQFTKFNWISQIHLQIFQIDFHFSLINSLNL